MAWPGLLRAMLRRLSGRPSGAGSEEKAAADPLTRVSALWADRAAESEDCPALPGVWTSHPVVRAAMNRRISGRGDVEWLAWAKQAFLPEPVGRALSLGCGGGQVEREAITLGLCREIEGVDVSGGAIELARQRAEAAGLAGISYRVADLNSILLPSARYDLVIVKQALHHIQALGHVLDQVKGSLRPGGWFLVNEYIGPSRFQWTDLQMEIMNQLLACLPERLRRLGEAVRERLERATPEQIGAHDPSEAVCSAEIVPLVEARFEVVARRDFGGTLLNPMLEGVITNFDVADENDAAMLRLLIAFEDILLERGVLTSDFAVLVVRPRVS
jgi:2-polyprenyl-3-methyl-5-hydroxy-6-metoxy-1,4-benzoquinol methylase